MHVSREVKVFMLKTFEMSGLHETAGLHDTECTGGGIFTVSGYLCPTLHPGIGF